MTIRFFILQAHYRSTVDFSNEALQAAAKGLERLMQAATLLARLTPADKTTADVAGLADRCRAAMDDDLNTPMVISHLFEAAKAINSIHDGKATITAADLDGLRATFHTYASDILGLRDETAQAADADDTPLRRAVDLLLDLRSEAKARKDWTTADSIRDRLTQLGFTIKDTKDGAQWHL